MQESHADGTPSPGVVRAKPLHQGAANMGTIARKDSHPERGAAGLIFVMFMGIALGIGALAIDLGEGLIAKAELSNATDAASLAASRELARIYNASPTKNPSTWMLTSAEQSRIVQKAVAVAALNRANGSPVTVRPADVVLGKFDPALGTIVPSTTGVRAVAVTGRLDGVANGPVPTVLARALGAQALTARSTATSGLLALGEVPAGTLNLPVGISSNWFKTKGCGPTATITFSPTGTASSCSGWHTYAATPSNVPRLKTIVCGLTSSPLCGRFQAPSATAGTTSFQFVGNPYDASTTAVPEILALYNEKPKDPTTGGWRVTVPVYEDTTCDTPVGPKKIVGFATVVLLKPQTTTTPPTITAFVQCGVGDYGNGQTGTDFGTFSGVPRMLN